VADFNAVAATSRTLRRLVLDRMATPVAVTLAPPDITVAGINGSRVNLYCFQVSEHAQLKNQAIAGQEHPAVYGHPPLSLTMRYLMTSYATSEDQQDSDLIAQAILADAMLVLHDFGGGWDELNLVTNRAGAIGDPLLDPVLQNEHERVKVTLSPASAEDLAKIWSAMPQANLRRGVVYDASVVQIEARVPRRRAAPVTSRHLLVSVARPPRIEAVYKTPPPLPAPQLLEPRIAIGEELTIEHAPIIANRIYVLLDGLEPIRVAPDISGKIRLPLPDAQYAPDLDHPVARPIPPGDRLQPGVLEIALIGVSATEGVQGGLDRGTPFSQDRSLRSNTLLMQLVPTITAATPNGKANAIIAIDGKRLWDGSGSSQVVIGDIVVPVRKPRAGDPWAVPIETHIEIPATAVAAVVDPGPTNYPVAVQVNGARSRDAGLTFRLDP
jgi:hypothetical protein